MIACQLFVLFALLEFGFVLFCRFVFKYKSLPKDYGEKQLGNAIGFQMSYDFNDSFFLIWYYFVYIYDLENDVDLILKDCQ